MNRRGLLLAAGGLSAFAGCSGTGADGGDGGEPTGTATETGPPTFDTTVVDETALQLTHAGGHRLAAGEVIFTVEFRVAGFETERIEERLDTDFGPGDSLFISRTDTGAVTYGRTAPDTGLPLERVVSITVRRSPGSAALATAGPVGVGLAPVEALFSVSVVDEVLVRVSHDGGDPLLLGLSAVIIDQNSPNGRSWSRFRLEERFAAGDHGWLWIDQNFHPVFVVGPKPDYEYPLSGTSDITFVDPYGDAAGSVTVTVGN